MRLIDELYEVGYALDHTANLWGVLLGDDVSDSTESQGFQCGALLRYDTDCATDLFHFDLCHC